MMSVFQICSDSEHESNLFFVYLKILTIIAGNIVIAIAATKSDLLHDTNYSNSLVSEKEARELAESVNAIYIDTSARNDENVNLLFQRVAERVLLIRERARIRGLEVNGNGVDAIPVTPGASVNEYGNVVKGYSNNDSRRSSVMSSQNKNIMNSDESLNKNDIGHNRRISNSSGIVMEDPVDENELSMGMCMGSLMECSASDKNSSCIIS
jgi:hypothetical protein